MSVELRPVTAAAAEAILEGRPPPDVAVADGYPTEFSTGIAEQAAHASPLGPFFVIAGGTVVGEIGGAVIAPGLAEIGYAVVEPLWGRGYATAAVRALVERARAERDLERIVAHTPLDRPASGRVLEKAGFACVGERDDEHEGELLKVLRWELPLGA